jgi:hypothetical protein
MNLKDNLINSISKHLDMQAIPLWKLELGIMKYDTKLEMFRSPSNYLLVMTDDIDDCLKTIPKNIERDNSIFFYYQDVALVKLKSEVDLDVNVDFYNILAIKKNFSYNEDLILSEVFFLFKKDYGIKWWLLPKDKIDILNLR